MAQSKSSRNEYERLMEQYQPAIAIRDRMVSQYCASAQERDAGANIQEVKVSKRRYWPFRRTN